MAMKVYDTNEAKEPLFPPLTPSLASPSPSRAGRVSRGLWTSNSLPSRYQGAMYTAISGRSSEDSVQSTLSGGSGVQEEKTCRPRSVSARSIDPDTLAIAVELRNLKARMRQDEEETFARIMDVSGRLGEYYKNPGGRLTPKPKVLTASPKTVRAPPPSEVNTAPGVRRHY